MVVCVEAIWGEVSGREVSASGNWGFLQGWNCLGGSFPGGTVLVGKLSGGKLFGGNGPGGNLPRTELRGVVIHQT